MQNALRPAGLRATAGRVTVTKLGGSMDIDDSGAPRAEDRSPSGARDTTRCDADHSTDLAEPSVPAGLAPDSAGACRPPELTDTALSASASGGAEGDDRDLVERIAQGDTEAEAILCRHFYQPVLFMLTHRTRNATLAQDLCQDTLLIVLRRLRNRGLREPDKLAAYVHRTAHFVYVSHVRKSIRHKAVADADVVQALGAMHDDPADNCHETTVRTLVRAALGGLTVARDREILSQYYLHETEKGVLCELLDLSPQHFDRVLHRARQRLGAVLAP
jgi:RNA polymerase sigma factor (sigma-70 family)